jgi:hypothetical protein
MTVKALIEILSERDPESLVYVAGSYRNLQLLYSWESSEGHVVLSP